MTGAELKAVRESRGESQEKFAVHFGVARNTISHWEANSPPRYAILLIDKLEKINGQPAHRQ